MTLKINIYDKKGKEVARVAEGQTVDIMLGTIENLMEILDIDKITNNLDLLQKVYGAYGEIKSVLSDVFGDITEDEWKRVKLKELVPTLKQIAMFTFGEMAKLPTDPKN